MKIIERKEPTNKWPRQFACGDGQTGDGFCGSVLELSAFDITQPGQRDGTKGWFRCPVCQALNYLTTEVTHEASQYLSRETFRATSAPVEQPGVMLGAAESEHSRWVAAREAERAEGSGHDCNY